MKRMKKIKLILAVIFLLMSNVVWSAEEYDLTSGDFVYTINSDGTATLKSYSGTATSVTIETLVYAYTILEDGSYGGRMPHPIREIGRRAFAGNTTIKEVYADNTILAIFGDQAFYGCTALERIFMPPSLDKFGTEVFAYCPNLKSFDLESVGNQHARVLWAIEGALLFVDENGNPDEILACAPQGLVDGTIDFGNLSTDYITKINAGAFEGCTTLTYITTYSTTEIGFNAFKDCTNLVTLGASSHVEIMGDSCFMNCCSLKDISSFRALKKIPKYAFYGCGSLVCGSSFYKINEIGKYAFAECYNLKYLSGLPIPCLKIIGERAFRNCEKFLYLTDVDLYFPDSLHTIEDFAFENCKFLSIVNFTENSQLRQIGNCAFKNCRDTEVGAHELLYFRFPESLEWIGEEAFAGSWFVSWPTFLDDKPSIKIPKNVGYIGLGAFADHHKEVNRFVVDSENQFYKAVDGVLLSKDGTRLLSYPKAKHTEVSVSDIDSVGYVIPKEVVTIDADAFYKTNVIHVVLPSNLSYIPAGAFAYCTKLKDITIPSTVKEIACGAFYGCSGLQSMFFMPKTPPVVNNGGLVNSLVYGYSTFYGVNCNLYVQAHKGSSNVENATEHPTNYYKSKYAGYIQTSDYPERPFKRVTHNIPLTMTSSGYMTIGRDFDVMIPHDYKNELKAYVVTGFNSDNATVTLKQLVVNHPAYPANDYKSVQHIPARYKDSDGYNAKYVGVILKGTPNKSYSIWMPRADYSVADEDRFTLQSDYNNELHTDLVETYKETEDDYNYIFLLKGGKIRKASANGIIAYNKAYLKLRKAAVDDMYSKGLGAKPLTAIFEDYDGTTSIDTIPADVLIGGNCNDDVFYTLTGIPVKNPGKGIYIKNGKKIVIR